MAIRSKDEQRALDKDEQELVAKTHHPQVQDLSDAELRDLAGLVRNRRDRARTQAHQRRREMRGKSAPQGATPSTADGGSRLKLEVLSMAMRRVNSEIDRRERLATKVSLVESARNALSMKQSAEDGKPHPNSRTAHEGMHSVTSDRRKNLVRPMELGRQRKAGQVAQAKRDAK